MGIEHPMVLIADDDERAIGQVVCIELGGGAADGAASLLALGCSDLACVSGPVAVAVRPGLPRRVVRWAA